MILIDVSTSSKTDDIQTLKAIREIDSKIPIIALVGAFDSGDAAIRARQTITIECENI